MLGILGGEARGDAIGAQLVHLERGGERLGKVGFERGDRDPAALCGIDVVAGVPSAEQRAGRRELVGARQGEPIGGVR